MKKLLSTMLFVVLCVFCIASCWLFSSCSSPSYNVTIQSDLMQGLILTGGDVEQTITNTNGFTPINIDVKYGYKYLYYELNGIKYCDNVISLNNVTENTTINVVCEYEKCILVYHTNSNNEINTDVKDFNEIVDYELPNPEKEGYIFEGWYFDSQLTEEYNVEQIAVGINNLYAKYRQNPYSYVVTIQSDLMQGLILTGGDAEQTITNTNSFTPINIDVKYGYKYLYYELNGIKYCDNVINLNSVTMDTTINVVCEYEKCILVYHTNSDDEINTDVKDLSEIVDYELPNPEKEGYTFEGWYFDSQLTEEYNVEQIVVGINNLYAKYRQNPYSYVVTIESNLMQGLILTGGDAEQTITNTNGFTPINIDVKYGYKYLYYELNGNRYRNNVISINGITSDITINVVCEYETCILVYHTNSDNEINTDVKDFNEIVDYELPNPEKEGYTFEGWYFDSQLTEEYNVEQIVVGINNLYAKYRQNPYSYVVTIESNLMQGLILTGGDAEQTITNTNSFTPINIDVKYGYKYLYYELNGIKYCDNVINLNSVTMDTTINVVCEYATYELPIVNIDTNNVKIKDKYNYVSMTFSITNCDSELNLVTGGIRLRGNTTSHFSKKPYRIKLDKKKSIFGLEESKSWVLLADYIDPSTLHNYAAFSLGKELDGLSFTPTPNKVNVYLNGEFQGLYTFCEQIQENKGRINIEKEITEDMTNLSDFNFFIAMDKSVTEEKDKILDETYFYIEQYNKYIELKYPEKADFVSDEQFTSFFEQLRTFVTTLFDEFTAQNSTYINEHCNVDSLIDYLIVDEIMGDIDHGSKSFNMYYTSTSSNEQENNKLNFGPIWDYDWCLYTPWTGTPNVSYSISNSIRYSNVFFSYIANNAQAFALLKTRYSEFSDTFGVVINNIMLYEYSIQESLKLNAIKWYEEEQIMYDNVIFLNRFLLHRKELLDRLWKNS